MKKIQFVRRMAMFEIKSGRLAVGDPLGTFVTIPLPVGVYRLDATADATGLVTTIGIEIQDETVATWVPARLDHPDPPRLWDGTSVVTDTAVIALLDAAHLTAWKRYVTEGFEAYNHGVGARVDARRESGLALLVCPDAGVKVVLAQTGNDGLFPMVLGFSEANSLSRVEIRDDLQAREVRRKLRVPPHLMLDRRIPLSVSLRGDHDDGAST